MTEWAGRTLELDFRPSRDGMPFANFWPKGAAIRVQRLSIGHVYGGLCGGMCELSRQLWIAGEPVPSNASPADPGFTDRLMKAQIGSLGLPAGPLRYLALQLPPRATARRKSTAQTLAAVRADLRADRPSLVGLLRTLSWSPAVLDKHHVVLAYGMREDPGQTTLSVYDPNHPGDDRARLTVLADSTIRTNRRDPQPRALLAF